MKYVLIPPGRNFSTTFHLTHILMFLFWQKSMKIFSATQRTCFYKFLFYGTEQSEISINPHGAEFFVFIIPLWFKKKLAKFFNLEFGSRPWVDPRNLFLKNRYWLSVHKVSNFSNKYGPWFLIMLDKPNQFRRGGIFNF